MGKTKSNSFSSRSFLLVAHYATFAYQDLLFEYLTKKGSRLVTKMNFPLPELPVLKHIEITHAEKGNIGTVKKIKSFYRPPILAYFLQSIQLLFLLKVSNKIYDVVIAEDSLLTFLCLILKKFNKCKIVIFYSHGLDKKRFKLGILNILYRRLEHFSATHCEYNWFLNRRVREFRKSQGIKEEKLFWIPSSVEVKTIARKTDIFNHKIVFLGVVNKKNGAHLIPKIIQEIKEAIPDVQLDIIGNGDLFKWTQKEIKRLKLEKNINLLEMLEFKDFSQILTNYSVGIAPYEDVFDTLTATSDSMKMRVYLTAGLPVVITRGFVFSDEIKENNLGFAVNFKVKSFAEAVIKLLQNRKLNQEIRKRALLYSQKYDIINIYNDTFKEIFRQIKATCSF